jgi:nucleotidyltransferase/DNA polymerase involved in DNA repair
MSIERWRAVSTLQHDPAVAQKLAHSIKREIQTQVGQCLTSSIGISANKLLAKLASNMQKPDGLVILPIETLPGGYPPLEAAGYSRHRPQP